MKAKFLLPALLLFLVTGFNACKKDEPSKSATDYLTQAGWKSSKTEIDLGTGTYQNIPIDDCNKDDVTKFNTDKSFSVKVNTKCDPSDPDETDESGIWAISADGKTLTIDGDNATIEVLNNDQLVISSTESSGGITYRGKATFIH